MIIALRSFYDVETKREYKIGDAVLWNGEDRINRYVSLGYVSVVDDSVSEPKKVDVLATDGAVKYAEKHNIDLFTIKGTGKDGKITLKDVKS